MRAGALRGSTITLGVPASGEQEPKKEEGREVDNLDRFNDTASKVATNWRNIFAFVACVFVLGTVLAAAGSSATAWLIISWIVVAIMACLVFFFRKQPKKESS